MRINNQKGASTVEFAIVVPLLLLILFGIIEFSILLYDKAMLTNASREGARLGIVFVPDRDDEIKRGLIEDSIRTAVDDYCKDNLISFGNSTVSIPDPDWSGYNSGDSLTVTVNYKFNFLAFSRLASLYGGNLDDAFNLSAVTIMRLE